MSDWIYVRFRRLRLTRRWMLYLAAMGLLAYLVTGLLRRPFRIRKAVPAGAVVRVQETAKDFLLSSQIPDPLVPPRREPAPGDPGTRQDVTAPSVVWDESITPGTFPGSKLRSPREPRRLVNPLVRPE